MAWTETEKAQRIVDIDAAIAQLELVKAKIAIGNHGFVLLASTHAMTLVGNALIAAAYAGGTSP